MKYIKLFEDFESQDPYNLSGVSANEKAEMIVDEMEKPEPNLNLVDYLISTGANLDWKNELYDDWTILHYSIFYNRIDIAKVLIDAGMDVNIKNKLNDTPLHFASYYNRNEIVKMLIDADSDINAQEDSGKTALHLAINNDNTQIVQMLIAAGGDKSIEDNYGETASDFAKSEKMKNILI
jgi:ankyrin repeat protein